MKKKLHIELLRIIAALFVIFNHTGGMGYELYALYPIGSLQYFIMLFLSVLCKVAVPIYLMISGALLLKKDQSLKEIWLVRIPRIFIVLLISSFIYYLASIKEDISSINLFDYLKGLYTNGFSGHLWYLYAYIAFLMCHPILRTIAKHLPNAAYGYLVLLYVVFSVISVLDTELLRVSITQKINPSWLWNDVFIFPLIGYCIEHIPTPASIKTRHRICVMAVGMTSLLLAIMLTHQNFVRLGQPAQTYHSLLVLLPSISLYILTKDFCEKISFSNSIEKLISTAGSCTFGVYLIHLVIPIRGILIDLLYEVLHLPLPIVSIGYCILIFLACAIVTFILKKIPFISSLL